jgi:hypothetical protein
MPWKECSVVEERLRFVARLLDGERALPAGDAWQLLDVLSCCTRLAPPLAAYLRRRSADGLRRAGIPEK